MAGVGIGEATAILTVAQIGISLSNTLIAYIGEVKEAPGRIQGITNEILTTSGRLKDIGELVERNQQSHIFNEEGINSAVRCSTECSKIIGDIKSVLCKRGWHQGSTPLDKDAIDISLFSSLRWPFVKTKLDVPRAELQRIKIDLSLLFSSAMVLGASNAGERQAFMQAIPGLKKSQEWAAKRAEEARRVQRSHHNPQSPIRTRNGQWIEDEPEQFQEYFSFKEQRVREKERQYIKERAALMKVEEEERKRQEDETRREVERRAVEMYKREQEEIQSQAAEKRENFRRELLKLGLGHEHIQLLLENSNLDFLGDGLKGHSGLPQHRSSSNVSEKAGLTSRPDPKEAGTSSSTDRKWRLGLPRWRSKKPAAEVPPEPSLDFMLYGKSTGSNRSLILEVWLIDKDSRQWTEIVPSIHWLEANEQRWRKEQYVWHCFAGLTLPWRNLILEFLKYKNGKGKKKDNWSLYHIEFPRKWSRTKLFGPQRGEQMLQLIIGRRSDPDKDDTQSWRSDHKPGGQLNGLPVGPKTPPPAPSSGVIIDRLAARPNGAVVELDEHGQKRRRNEGSTAVNHDPRLSQPVAHRRHEQELGQRIKCLEAKKTSLRSDDHERLAELNDMIAILGDQLKLLKSLTYVQEGPSFDETLIEVIEPSARNSEAARRRHEKDIERLHFDIVRRPEEGLREEEYEYRKKELQEDQRRYNVAEYDAGEAYQYQHGPSRGGLSQRPRSRADEVRAWLYDPGTEEGYEEARRQSGRPIPRHLDKHSPEPHGSDWSLVKEGPTQHQPSKQESVRFADEELFIRRPRPRATSWERTRPSIKSELDEDVLRGRELRASRQHQGGFITDATGSSRALVSRAGRHRSYAYPRDRVLLEDVDKTFGRRQAPRNPQKYRGDLSSEDDDFERKFMSRERAGPGIELSDNEVITKILNQFTTFQGNELPLLEKISPIVPTKNNEQTSSDSSLKQAADQQAAASTGATDIAQNRTDNEKQRSSGSSGTDDGRQRGRLRRRKSKSRGQDPNAAVAQPDLASGTASVILRRIIGWREPGDKDKGKADRGKETTIPALKNQPNGGTDDLRHQDILEETPVMTGEDPPHPHHTPSPGPPYEPTHPSTIESGIDSSFPFASRPVDSPPGIPGTRPTQGPLLLKYRDDPPHWKEETSEDAVEEERLGSNGISRRTTVEDLDIYDDQI